MRLELDPNNMNNQKEQFPSLLQSAEDERRQILNAGTDASNRPSRPSRIGVRKARNELQKLFKANPKTSVLVWHDTENIGNSIREIGREP